MVFNGHQAMQLSDPWSTKEVSHIIAPTYCLGKVYGLNQRMENQGRTQCCELRRSCWASNSGQGGHRSQDRVQSCTEKELHRSAHGDTRFFSWVMMSICMWRSYLRPRKKTSEWIKGEKPQSLNKSGNCSCVCVRTAWWEHNSQGIKYSEPSIASVMGQKQP